MYILQAVQAIRVSIGDFLKESECLYEEERKASCASRIAVVGQAMMTAGSNTDEKNKEQGSEKIADAVMSNGAANVHSKGAIKASQGINDASATAVSSVELFAPVAADSAAPAASHVALPVEGKVTTFASPEKANSQKQQDAEAGSNGNKMKGNENNVRIMKPLT